MLQHGRERRGEDQALERLRGLADETVEQAWRVRREASQAAGAVIQAHQQATSARVRAALAKRRELPAHARAIKLHEQAARLQERLATPTGPPAPAPTPSTPANSNGRRSRSSATRNGDAGRRWLAVQAGTALGAAGWGVG